MEDPATSSAALRQEIASPFHCVEATELFRDSCLELVKGVDLFRASEAHQLLPPVHGVSAQESDRIRGLFRVCHGGPEPEILPELE